MAPPSLTCRAAAAGLAASAFSGAAAAQEAAPWSSGTGRASTVVPPGAVDYHFHTYDCRYPTAPGATKPVHHGKPDRNAAAGGAGHTGF